METSLNVYDRNLRVTVYEGTPVGFATISVHK